MMTTASRTPLVLERIDDDRCPTTYYSMAESEAGGGGGGGGAGNSDGEKEKRKGSRTALAAMYSTYCMYVESLSPCMFMFC